MKKVITTFLAILLILCSLFTLTACHEYHSVHEEDYRVGYCEELNDAFLGIFYWRGHLGEDMDIYLPDTYNGAPITALGGYIGIGAPSPFRINFWEKSNLEEELFGGVSHWRSIGCEYHINTQNEVYDEVKAQLKKYYRIEKEFEIQDVVFNLHVGANLNRLEDTWCCKDVYFVDSEDDEILTVYAFSFVIIVDEQNEYFYSDELGRMYYKESGNIVEEFLYHNRADFPEGSLPTLSDSQTEPNQ